MSTAVRKGTIAVCSRTAMATPAALERLEAQGYRVAIAPSGATPGREELQALLREAAALLIGTQKIDAELLAGAPFLRAIAKTGAGTDNIDVAAARQRRIAVFSFPGMNGEAVADYTLAMLLALTRHLIQAHQSVVEGKWVRFTGTALAGKTLGIVGLGAIGKAVARRAAGFGLKVIAFDVQFDHDFARAYDVRQVSLSQVLAEADILSLHSPLLPETCHLIRAETIATMKPGAILINAARGGLVHTEDLLAALEAGRLSGAALDVLEEEPPRPELVIRLTQLPVILSPHNAAYTHEALAATATAACEAVLHHLEKGQTR